MATGDVRVTAESAAGPRARPRGARRRRLGSPILLSAVVVGCVVLAVVGMVLTWPDRDVEGLDGASLSDAGVQYVTAEVTGTRLERCDSTGEDRLPDGTLPDTVDCLRVHATVASGPRAGTPIQVWATATLTPADVPEGTRIVAERYPATDGGADLWAWSDFARGVPLTGLALTFVVITALVARWRGVRALIGLALAFVVLWAYVLPGLVAGEDPVVLALAGSTLIMVTVLYLAHGLSQRTTTALLGTLVGLALVAALGGLGARLAHLSPVTSEEDFRLAALLGSDGVSILRGVFLCGVVLAGLGVLNDVTITQASAVFELRAADPGASWRHLFQGGMRIGRDHIASTIYTIAFAYAGASLPVLLLLQIYQQPLVQTLTSGPFAEEIVRTLAGSMALILAIPFTTAIAAAVAVSSPAPARHGARAAVGHVH